MTKQCCTKPSVKTLTTDTGMVYACERCSRHWFRTYENAASMFAEQERCPPVEPRAEPPQDYAEVVLRVEIASDTEAKVKSAREKIVALLLDSPAEGGDFMVTIHGWKDLPIFEVSPSPVKSEAEPVSDDELISALTTVTMKVINNSQELDPEAKRVLYANAQRLYRR